MLVDTCFRIFDTTKQHKTNLYKNSLTALEPVYSFRARHDTTVAEKLVLVSRATRATCIFGISGVLVAMFVFAQFESFSA